AEVRATTAEECLRRMQTEKKAELAGRDRRIQALENELAAAHIAAAESEQRCASQCRELASLTQHLEMVTADAAAAAAAAAATDRMLTAARMELEAQAEELAALRRDRATATAAADGATGDAAAAAER
ncbi:unnamed protein product, partial [Phaeothamnion confervicola]